MGTRFPRGKIEPFVAGVAWARGPTGSPSRARARLQMLPQRWIVERTFGWLNRWRRLSKDYEHLTDTSESTIRVAVIYLMVRRLAE